MSLQMHTGGLSTLDQAELNCSCRPVQVQLCACGAGQHLAPTLALAIQTCNWHSVSMPAYFFGLVCEPVDNADLS